MEEKSYDNLSRVIFMSTIQMLFQSIANSIMGILSQITQQNNIWWAGPLSTLILFVFSGFGSLYNKYIGKIQYRYTFFIGSTGYTLYCACSIAFVYADSFQGIIPVLLICLLNIIGGLILSSLYVSQFNYVSECSKADNQSMYFGVALGIVQSANVVGNLLSAYIVEPLGQKRYSVIMTLLIFVISLGFLFVRQVDVGIKQVDQIQDGKNSSEEIIESDKETIKPFSPKQMQNIMPSFLLLGVVIAFVYVFLSLFISSIFKDEMTPLQLNSLTFKIFIVEGAGEFVGGLTYVFLSQRVSKKLFLLSTHKLLTLSTLLLLTSLYIKSIYLLGFSTFILGFVDCCSYSLDLAIVSDENWGKSGYSYFNILQCTGVAISIICIMFATNQVFMGYVLAFQLITSFFLHNFRPKAKR